MGLNKSTGNMYKFITHTWNTVKGQCHHDCSYCYMKRFGKLNPIRFDEKELKTDLGKDNWIFVGSSCDMWAKDIPEKWIVDTINRCTNFDNKYFFQTKNPKSILLGLLPIGSSVCVTIETNRWYSEIMNNSPHPDERAWFASQIRNPLYITIEPLLDFDLYKFVAFLKYASPMQINIGADSGNNNLPEPSKEKLVELMNELETFTVIHKKSNLKRILRG